MGYADLTGQRFGRLTVICRGEDYISPTFTDGTDERPKKTKRWRCLCDCGTYVDVSTHSLTSGSTKSCGCYHREVAAERMRNREIRNTFRPNSGWKKKKKRKKKEVKKPDGHGEQTEKG